MESTVKLPKSLIKRVEKFCLGTRQTPQQFIVNAVTDYLDRMEPLLAHVEAGLADVEAGRVISSDEMRKELGLEVSETNNTASP